LDISAKFFNIGYTSLSFLFLLPLAKDTLLAEDENENKDGEGKSVSN